MKRSIKAPTDRYASFAWNCKAVAPRSVGTHSTRYLRFFTTKNEQTHDQDKRKDGGGEQTALDVVLAILRTQSHQ